VHLHVGVHYYSKAAVEEDSTEVRAYTAVDMAVQHMVPQWRILLGKGLVQRA